MTFILVKAQSDEAKLETALYNLPDVSFTKTSKAGDKYLQYDLLIKQPLDHQHREKGSFYQRVKLIHKGFDNPTVIETEGYWLWGGGTGDEVEQILNTNYVDVEYRYYGKSLPDSIDWQYLTIAQAAADLHHINELFKTIYTNKWISTGISKGGETTIYYKYFYPHDVDLAIPYVAPIDNSLEDKRIYHFFDTIGTPECRQKIKDFQTFLLQHEKEVLPKLEWYSKGANLHYNYTGSIGKSFEYAVLEFSFSFWQYNGNCDSVPSNKNVDDYIDVLMKNGGLLPFSDEGLKEFEAHYYQAQTESGYYGYNIEPFKQYLHYFTSNPSGAFPPKNAPAKPYDSSLNINVQNWLKDSGNNMLYIYGGFDTWSSAGVIVSDKVNSKRFTIPNTSHATARIQNMPADMQTEFVNKVKEMIGLNADVEVLKK
jgi:hypothetical protein